MPVRGEFWPIDRQPDTGKPASQHRWLGLWVPTASVNLATQAGGPPVLANTDIERHTHGAAWVNTLNSNCSVALLPGDSTPLQTVTIILMGGVPSSSVYGEFGVSSGTGSDRMSGHVPYTDGTVYWDFGGSTAGATRVSVAGLTITQNDVWAFTTGPRGMEIWQNGRLRASNSANPTRTNAVGGAWGFGANGAVWSLTSRGPSRWYGAAMSPEQLPPGFLSRLTNIPAAWEVLFEPLQIDVEVPAAAAGSFTSTGALAAAAAEIAGTAAHYTLHASSGALSAQAAVVAGTATHLTLHTSSGALEAGAAVVAGTANHVTVHTATGALEAQAAEVAGDAAHTSDGAFSATGALSADAAAVAGTATHYTLHTSTGALAADAATVAGTAQHLTLHTATGALVADPASVSGVAEHTGDGAVVQTRNQGAGKSRRKSQRYVLAIDGKDVIVSGYAEAQALIDSAKEAAEAKADEALQRANASQRRPIGKVIRDARKALVVPSIEAPPELADYARKVLDDIQATYAQRLRDIEITALMRQRERQQQEEDDEDILMLIA